MIQRLINTVRSVMMHICLRVWKPMFLRTNNELECENFASSWWEREDSHGMLPHF